LPLAAPPKARREVFCFGHTADNFLAGAAGTLKGDVGDGIAVTAAQNGSLGEIFLVAGRRETLPVVAINPSFPAAKSDEYPAGFSAGGLDPSRLRDGSKEIR